MNWAKKGLIYQAEFEDNWRHNSAICPTPYLMNEDVIRIYVGFRDKEGRARAGFVDVESKKPSNIIGISENPIIDLGTPGCFDANGVVPTVITKINNKMHLYYAGYQIPTKVRTMIFTGVAISEDGEIFHKYKKVPVMDRTDKECLFRSMTSIVTEDRFIRVYYAGGSEFIQGKEKTLPIINIRHTTTTDGLNFSENYDLAMDTSKNEYRVVRPYVIKENGLYKMYFSAGSEKITYKFAYAESNNGVDWVRCDHKLNLGLSKEGWDSKMMSYPAVIKTKYGVYMFYNGNNFGYDGFGYAELEVTK